MVIKKKAFTTLIMFWASLDLPSLAGTLIFCSGLILAAYIWKRWGQSEDFPNYPARKISLMSGWSHFSEYFKYFSKKNRKGGDFSLCTTYIKENDLKKETI